jgi:UDP-glucose 4-epimerase
MYLQAFRAQGRSVTILRPANAYGPGQQLKSGFGLVRTMLEHIRRNTVLEVWGDGTAVRDYVYVDDVASACVRFVDQPGDNGSYNVGSGIGQSINELVRCVNAVCSRELQVAYRPARRSDVAQVVLDIAQLRATGWQPRIDLAEGLRRTWAWLQGQP